MEMCLRLPSRLCVAAGSIPVKGGDSFKCKELHLSCTLIGLLSCAEITSSQKSPFNSVSDNIIRCGWVKTLKVTRLPITTKSYKCATTNKGSDIIKDLLKLSRACKISTGLAEGWGRSFYRKLRQQAAWYSESLLILSVDEDIWSLLRKWD